MFGSIIFLVVGISIAIMGYLIWIKEKITLLHDYHYDKVREEDKKVFCKVSGIGLLIIGIGIFITGIITAFKISFISFLPFILGFIIGIIMVIFAGAKYNKWLKNS